MHSASAFAVARHRSEASLTGQLAKTKRRLLGFSKSLVGKLGEPQEKSDVSDEREARAHDIWLQFLAAAKIVVSVFFYSSLEVLLISARRDAARTTFPTCAFHWHFC